jgi:hypothetical protein
MTPQYKPKGVKCLDVIIPTVLNADLSSFYTLQDHSPGPEKSYEVKEIVLQSLRELSKLKRKIILLLMIGFEPKNIATYLRTNEMAVTRAKRNFWAQLVENGLEM